MKGFRLWFFVFIGVLSVNLRAGESVGFTPHRIVSLSPSVTETLFALGLGERVVGVTRYCTYPEEAKEKSVVGGYLDTNYEKILELQPDLVITIVEHKRAIERLKTFHIRVLSVNHRDIEGILESIVEIGRLCGVEDASDRLLLDIQTRLDRVQNNLHKNRSGGKPWKAPRVLVSIGRTWGAKGISQLNIAGKEGFLSAMLHLAGGQNAYRGSIPFPMITREGLMELNPDVIIELVPDLAEKGLSKDKLLNDWLQVTELDAVRKKQVTIFTDTYLVIPGPRFVEAVERFYTLFSSYQAE